ncbi:MAG: hypothetical protein ABWX69_00040 [Arthrobacter sp.]
MEDPTTIALNLTFFGTLGVALVMAFGLFLAVVATLVLAGLGRLVAVAIMAVGRGLSRTAGGPGRPADAVQQGGGVRATGVTQPRPPKDAKPVTAAKPGKPAKREPALSPDWADAVAQADARAAARAKAQEAPDVKVSVRELPSPTTPARDLTTVAPLVESATDRNGQLGTAPPGPDASIGARCEFRAGHRLTDPPSRPAAAAAEALGQPAEPPAAQAPGTGAQSRLRPYRGEASRLR